MSQQDNLGQDKDLEMEDDKPDIAVTLSKIKFLETLFHLNLFSFTYLRVNITLVLLPYLHHVQPFGEPCRRLSSMDMSCT
jgi:hypothetical protein